MNRWATRRVWQDSSIEMRNQTAPMTTQIVAQLEAGGVYEWMLRIAYQAAGGVDVGEHQALAGWWDLSPGVSIARWPLSYIPQGPTGLNTGATVIMRRPGPTTVQVIGGSSLGNSHGALDHGVMEATADGTATWLIRQTGTGSSTPTTLLGGPTGTQLTYRRIN
ncbi:hypothetical protein [Streptomyces bohaiensis]|uniref:hypothetical protein n=1 Tax=Streptomyces bohaiensis TaxID=1431344 RepID=UPI003B7640D7